LKEKEGEEEEIQRNFIAPLFPYPCASCCFQTAPLNANKMVRARSCMNTHNQQLTNCARDKCNRSTIGAFFKNANFLFSLCTPASLSNFVD
jgi:hypothetical protein